MVILKEDKNLDLFTEIPVENFNNYLISKNEIVYNKKIKTYTIPHLHKNTNCHTISLNNSKHQIKHLLYITFIIYYIY